MAVCSICGSIDNHERQTKSIERVDVMLGEIRVPDITCEVCLNCGEPVVLDQKAWEAVNTYMDARLAELVGKLPISAFYSEKEACRLLGWDVFPKYRYVMFVMISIDNKKFFYKPSVEKYASSKQHLNGHSSDGRLNLIEELKRLGIKP